VVLRFELHPAEGTDRDAAFNMMSSQNRMRIAMLEARKAFNSARAIVVVVSKTKFQLLPVMLKEASLTTGAQSSNFSCVSY
jgi:hypothetical protein